MHKPYAAIVAAGLALAAPPASAQWQQLPSHDWAYDFNFITTGAFSCGRPQFIRNGTCTATGNSVLLTYGDASLKLTFIGVSQPTTLVTGPSDGKVTLTLGHIEQEVGGEGDFLFPHGPASGLFRLHLGLTSALMLGDIPFVESTTKTMLAYVRGGPQESTGMVGRALGTTLWDVAPTPPGVGVGAIVFERFRTQQIVPGGGSVAVTANVAMVPEPATVALLGGGLLAIGGVGLLRRTRG